MASKFLLGCFDRGVNLALIGDVELEHQSFSFRCQAFHLIRMAGGHHRPIAALKHIFGKLGAETGRAARDETKRAFR